MLTALHRRFFNICLRLIGISGLVLGCLFASKAIYLANGPDLQAEAHALSGNLILDSASISLLCLIAGIFFTSIRPYHPDALRDRKTLMAAGLVRQNWWTGDLLSK